MPRLYLVAAYAQKGDMAKATAAKTELLKGRPGLSMAQLSRLRPSDNAVYLQQRDRLNASLRKAGIPEQ